MEENVIRGTLVIKDRKTVTLDGVKNVIGFDESYVSLSTESGRVVIEGAELKIESLTREGGEILISGRIDAAYYSSDKASKGVFARLFG